MSFIEKVFLAVLYGMYLYDCIFWIAPGQLAFTRSSAADWKTWQRRPLSFTLLGRIPVLVSPLLLYPGVIRTTAGPSKEISRNLRKVGKRLNAMYALLTLCRAQAVLLLVYLPALLALHRLVALWPLLLALLAITHLLLCTFAILALRSAKPGAWLTPAASLVFNPLGATRALDILAQAFFDRQSPPKP